MVPLGHTNKAPCQTAPNDRLVLTCTLWLFLYFTEHIAALSLYSIQDISGVQKKLSQNPAVLAR